jgi:serine/threonine-protein kinase HipA
VVFNILIHNTDDHLRNHGFLVDESGIRLSPAYDINPSVDRQELTLAINEVETACDVSIAMEASHDYGLNPREAADVLKQVQDAVAGWQKEATRLNIPKAEMDLMATAFQG